MSSLRNFRLEDLLMEIRRR